MDYVTGLIIFGWAIPALILIPLMTSMVYYADQIQRKYLGHKFQHPMWMAMIGAVGICLIPGINVYLLLTRGYMYWKSILADRETIKMLNLALKSSQLFRFNGEVVDIESARGKRDDRIFH